MRQLLCILILLCLPLQSLALQVGWSQPGQPADLIHEIEHHEGIQHHHEDDGSVHYDNSAESQEHVQDHCTSAQPADLMATLVSVAPQPLVSVLKPEQNCLIASPYIEGPTRPPALALGPAAGGLMLT